MDCVSYNHPIVLGSQQPIAFGVYNAHVVVAAVGSLIVPLPIALGVRSA
jgi:hypothetical protein